MNIHSVFQRSAFGRKGRDIGGNERCAHFAAMGIGTVEPVDVVPGRLEIRCLDGDEPAEFLGMQRCKLQSDAPSHRTARQDGAIKTKPFDHGQHGFDIGLGSQKVFLDLEPFGRQRFAMPRHVEGDQAVRCGDLRIVHQVTPLAGISASGVQTDDRTTLPCLLKIDAAWRAIEW